MQEVYETTDLSLAAFLKAKGWFIRFKSFSGKCIFSFVDDAELREDIISYFNNGKIGITDYKNAVMDLKVIVHNV